MGPRSTTTRASRPTRSAELRTSNFPAVSLRAYALLLFTSLPTASLASSCWNTFLLSEAAERQGTEIYEIIADRVDYIFVGEALLTEKTTVRQKGHEEWLSDVQTQFRIVESYKGAPQPEVVVSGGEVADCGCRYDFEPGVEYFVLANRTKNSLVTYYCNFIAPRKSAFIDDFKKYSKPKNTRQ